MQNQNVKPQTTLGMNADVIIVGGGLAGGLTALRFSQKHPDKKVLLLERGTRLGGNHTWFFFDTSISNNENWLESLISKSWAENEVRFPKISRISASQSHCIRSDDFHKQLTLKLGRNVRLNCETRRITDCEVETTSGEILRAPLIIDASGISPSEQTNRTFAGAPCGWSKSLGFDLRLKKPHGLDRPLIVDAVVPQMDGYRYFSCLPLDEKRIFIAEHFLSASPDLNHERISRSIRAYAERAGWEIESIERTEEEKMPLPLYDLSFDQKNETVIEFDSEDFIDQSPVSISTGAGWFHSSTSDSLPDSVRIADFICSLSQHRTGPVRAEMRKFRDEWADQQRFFRLLNRLIFRAVEPSLRYQVFERFFGQRDDLIERYFAGTSLRTDRPKILGAKRPVRPGRLTQRWAEETP